MAEKSHPTDLQYKMCSEFRLSQNFLEDKLRNRKKFDPVKQSKNSKNFPKHSLDVFYTVITDEIHV